MLIIPSIRNNMGGLKPPSKYYNNAANCSPFNSSGVHLITAKFPFDSLSMVLIHSTSLLAFAFSISLVVSVA